MSATEEAFRREGPWPLPEGWVWARLGAVSSFIGRGRGPKYVETDGIPVVNQKCIRWGYVDITKIRLTSRESFDNISADLHLRFGDILWNSTGTGTIGRVAVYDGSLDDATVDSHVTIVRSENADPYFLCYYLQTIRVQQLVLGANVGSTNQLELPRRFVQELWCPIPPLAEQRRIVARIDELFTEIADGETALARARADLDTWRRALLKAAVTGELTREWREENRPGETGEDVLERVVRERGVYAFTGSRSHRARTTQLIPVGEFDLPGGWVWSRLDSLGEIVGGVTVDKNRLPTNSIEVPYLRVANVQRGHLALDNVKVISVEKSRAENLQLRTGDILLNEGGDRDKVGRGWIWEGQIENCIHQNHVFRLRLYEKNMNPYFISHYANEMGRRFFLENGRQTTNLASISLSTVSRLPVPVGPAEEIDEAMRLLGQYLVALEDVEKHINDAPSAAVARQSILKSAFEGRLVPQDPAEEPAEVMLTRLGSAVDEDRPVRRSRRPVQRRVAQRGGTAA